MLYSGTKQDLGQDLPCDSISESVEPSVSDADQNSDLFPSWSDSSGSDSSGDDLETKPAQDTLSFSMKSVEDLIDQLIQLGKIIRSSGARSRFRKADKTFDPAAHKDLQHYLTVLLLSNPRAIENRRPSAEHIALSTNLIWAIKRLSIILSQPISGGAADLITLVNMPKSSRRTTILKSLSKTHRLVLIRMTWSNTAMLLLHLGCPRKRQRSKALHPMKP